MANYHYDEAGNMALYFLLSFLAIALVPLTLSASTSKKKKSLSGCECEACTKQRKTIAKLEANSWLNPFGWSKKGFVIFFGWLLFAFVCYKVANLKQDSKVYDPFEILGIRTGSSEKEIKSHYKKLSRKFHPDKVRATANETLEMIQERFVSITKAYKSLTDETIRKNWELWGHPDGRQEMSMGIALPSWIIEGKNNIWVLGFYGLVFGGALPALVGRWWFGSQRKTKDGITTRSAASFFKSLRDSANMHEVVGTLGKAYQWDHPPQMKRSAVDSTVESLEKQIKDKVGDKWESVSALVGVHSAEDGVKRRALILLYAYLLRLPLEHLDLKTEQARVVLQTPLLLNALLSMSTSRNWLHSTLSILRLHSYLAQALLPSTGSGVSRLRFAQLPGIKTEEVELDGPLAPKAKDYPDFVKTLEDAGDSRSTEAKKAISKWGRLDIVDAYFKVIGERIVVPSSIVFLILKLRLVPPLHSETPVELTKEEIKQSEEKDREFLTGPNTMENVVFKDKDSFRYAHAPYWPANRAPGWWIVLADEKGGKLVLPPTRITEVPFTGTLQGNRDYRTYRIQFQAPNGAGVFPWKAIFISDTFVGEEIHRNLTLDVEDWSALNADEQGSEDEISDPDEDTLAGQMAVMRGGKVKKHEEEESDDESTTDGDQSDNSDSDSDSD